MLMGKMEGDQKFDQSFKLMKVSKRFYEKPPKTAEARGDKGQEHVRQH
jgi:hypothetical protein